MNGLSVKELEMKFSEEISALVIQRLEDLAKRHLVVQETGHWRLTKQGIVLSNLVFEKLLFSAEEIEKLKS